MAAGGPVRAAAGIKPRAAPALGPCAPGDAPKQGGCWRGGGRWGPGDRGRGQHPRGAPARDAGVGRGRACGLGISRHGALLKRGSGRARWGGVKRRGGVELSPGPPSTHTAPQLRPASERPPRLDCPPADAPGGRRGAREGAGSFCTFCARELRRRFEPPRAFRARRPGERGHTPRQRGDRGRGSSPGRFRGGRRRNRSFLGYRGGRRAPRGTCGKR